jgi:hypothetical protein
MDGGIYDIKQNGALVGKIFVIKLGGANPPNTFVEHWVTLSRYVRNASFQVNFSAAASTYGDFKTYLAGAQDPSVHVTERFLP